MQEYYAETFAAWVYENSGSGKMPGAYGWLSEFNLSNQPAWVVERMKYYSLAEAAQDLIINPLKERLGG